MRDQKKIETIKAETNLNNPRQVYELFSELQSGAYRFETAIGNDFDDEIYEKIEELKKKGITAENAAHASAVKKRNPKTIKKIKKQRWKNQPANQRAKFPKLINKVKGIKKLQKM